MLGCRRLNQIEKIDYLLLKCMDSRAGIKGNVNKLKVNQNDFN